MDILLKGGVALIYLALAIAWLGTFTRFFVIPGLDGGLVKDYKTLVKAHLDYILMALFLLVFYALKTPIPVTACWLMVIGGITNPGVFVIMMVKPNAWEYQWMRIYTAASFVITTVGFVWAGAALLESAG